MLSFRQSKIKEIFSSGILFVYGLMFFLILAGGIFGTRLLVDHSRQEIVEGSKTSLYVLTQLVNREMEEIDKIAKILSTSPGVIAGLRADPSGLDLANKVLDRYAEGLASAVCYALDLQGKVIASSNREQPDSFVGQSYYFREYFKEGMEGKAARSFLVGKTSQKKGYYSSCPVYDSNGKIIGLVVAKKDADALIENFKKFPHSFLLDPDGTIFFSDANDLSSLQFEPTMKEFLKILNKESETKNKSGVMLNQDFLKDGQEIVLHKHRHFIFKSRVSLDHWQVMYIVSADQMVFYQFFGVIVTALFF